MIKKILRPTTVISCGTMQEDWEGFDLRRKNFIETNKTKKQFFSFFLAPFFSALIFFALFPHVGLNIFVLSYWTQIFEPEVPQKVSIMLRYLDKS
jgi:hypothetical protein